MVLTEEETFRKTVNGKLIRQMKIDIPEKSFDPGVGGIGFLVRNILFFQKYPIYIDQELSKQCLSEKTVSKLFSRKDLSSSGRISFMRSCRRESRRIRLKLLSLAF